MLNKVQTEDNFRDLKESPIYNISLCSLENFHTNFWKWLGNNYPERFLKIFKGILELSDEDYQTIKVEECNDQVSFGKEARPDLTIKLSSPQMNIFIENKLKSFPTDNQLEKYTEVVNEKCKDSNNKFILLSLAGKNVLPSDWAYMGYSELASKMEELFVNFYNDYHKYLIKDYINVIKKLSEEFERAIKNCNSKYDFYKEKRLNEIRLRDIYVKYCGQELGNFIRNNLPEGVNLGVGFNNKKATIHLSKDLGDGFYIGIQIEGDQYRYYMIIPGCNQQERIEIASKFSEQELWFNLANKNNSRMRELKKNDVENNCFCHYEPDFIYRYSNLDLLFDKELHLITYDEISDKIVEDFNSIEINWQKICEIIKK